MSSPSRSFLHIFLFTNIHNLSISLPHSLALSLLCISLPLSLQPRSLSLFRHVNHPRLFTSLTLSLSSSTLNHFTLFYFGCFLSLSLSLSFFTHVNSHFSNIYTIPLSLSHVLAFLSLQPCSPPLFPLSLFFFLYLSPIISLSLSLSLSLSPSLSLFSHAHPFYYLLLWTPPASLSLTPLSLTPPFSHSPFLSLPLSLTPAFSHSCFLSLPLSLFNHTHTHFTIFSYVNRHSSDTYTTPISLSLSCCLPLSLPPSLSLSLSLPPYLSFINFP